MQMKPPMIKSVLYTQIRYNETFVITNFSPGYQEVRYNQSWLYYNIMVTWWKICELYHLNTWFSLFCLCSLVALVLRSAFFFQTSPGSARRGNLTLVTRPWFWKMNLWVTRTLHAKNAGKFPVSSTYQSDRSKFGSRIVGWRERNWTSERRPW